MHSSGEIEVQKDGMIVIPNEIRIKIGIKEGSKLKLRIEEDKIIFEKVIERKAEESVKQATEKEKKSPPPLHLLYRPEITSDPISGEEIQRNLDLEARLMNIPIFAKLAKRGFFIVSKRNRLIAFGFETVEQAMQEYYLKGIIKKGDYEKAGIEATYE